MDDTEKLLVKLLKSSHLPDLSDDFNSSLTTMISSLTQPKRLIIKPLINPVILVIGLIITILITALLIQSGFTFQSKINDLLPIVGIIEYINKFLNNYMIISFALLVLFWFILDYIISEYKKVNMILLILKIKKI